MTARTPLSNRRPSATIDTAFRGFPITITVGYDLTATVREVFANSGKSGSDMQATLADACVLISIALQHGVTPAALAKSLGRVPDPAAGDGATDHASPIGAIVAALG